MKKLYKFYSKNNEIDANARQEPRRLDIQTLDIRHLWHAALKTILFIQNTINS